MLFKPHWSPGSGTRAREWRMGSFRVLNPREREKGGPPQSRIMLKSGRKGVSKTKMDAQKVRS